MNQKYKKLIKNIFIFALGNIGSKLISFILVPLYTAVLSTGEYGVADIIATTSTLLLPIVSLMMQDAVIYFGLKKEYDIKKVITGSCCIAGGGTIVALFISFGLGQLSFLKGYEIYLVLITIFGMYNNILFNYVKVKDKNILYSFASILYTLSLLILNILYLVVFKRGVPGYLRANAIAHIIEFVFLFFTSRIYKDISIKSFDPGFTRIMIRYVLPLIPNAISWWIIYSCDKYLIQFICDSSELGIYTAATKIPTLISVLTNIFTQAWTISSITEYGEEKSKAFYDSVLKHIGLISIFAAWFLSAFARPIMGVYVGKAFDESWKLVPVIVIGSGAAVFASYCEAVYRAAKANFGIMISTVITAIINALVGLILIPYIGAAGAAWGTAISYTFMAFYRIINVKKYYDLETHPIKMGISFGLLAAQAIVIVLTKFGLVFSAISFGVLILVNKNDIAMFLTSLKNMLSKKKQSKITDKED